MSQCTHIPGTSNGIIGECLQCKIKHLKAENAALEAELKTTKGALRTLAIEIRKRTPRDPEDNPDEIEQYWIDYALAHPTEEK
jgi:hypothetical protein